MTKEKNIGKCRSGEDVRPTIILYQYTETQAKYNAIENLMVLELYLEDGCIFFHNLNI